MLSLKCCAQNYDWGRDAVHSEVAKLAQANGNEIDQTRPYAELWMGTHPNCPSKVASSGQSLQEWIAQHPQSLGNKVLQRFGSNLPFLFKVLSVNKALSIQSHPDKMLAEVLHKEHPKMYPDNNHKPEMALAITAFEALCGFVATEELQGALRDVPELAQCIGEEATQAILKAADLDKEVLKSAFSALMSTDPAKVCGLVRSLVARLSSKASTKELGLKEQLALRLNQQYPDDVGIFSSFFLNLVTLQPGQAIYLPANQPHAYLSGELMEVMATSDNVIRAGLTPKFKHVEVLCKSLTYEQGLPEVLTGTPVAEGVRVYRPPFEEFELQAVEVPQDRALQLPSNPGPLVLLVQFGCGSAHATAPSDFAAAELQTDVEVHRGSILFIPAGTQVTITAQQDLSMWAAACNGLFFSLHGMLNGAAVPAQVSAATPVLAMA